MGRWAAFHHRSSIGAAALALALTGAGCAEAPAGNESGGGGTTVPVGPVTAPPTGAPTAGIGGSATPVGPGGTTGPGDVGTGAGGAVTGAVPCEVDTIVKARCQTCHGATPIGGAPMSLVTLADFQKDHVVKSTTQLLGQTLKVYELSRIRINREQGTMAMPQGSPLAPADLGALNTWLGAGALAGTACVADPGGTVGPMAGTGGTVDPGATYQGGNRCENDPSAFEPLVARDGETCYEFLTHGVSSPTDTSKFSVPTGESYNQFYYSIPWPAGTVATRFGAKFDNLPVLHHWLGFSSSAANAPGTVATNVLGTTLGEAAELVGGWAVGGCNVDFPSDMGLKLPESGMIMIQWHHYNNTAGAALDGSAVQWCTVPSTMRANIGGLTFLGTEFFNGPLGMPPGMSEFGGACANASSGDITIVGFNPHLHLLGVNMKSVITRAGGTDETVFDEPFLFDHQVNYMMNPPVVLKPGEVITSTCTFNNTTPANVAFGQSTKQEMCYQFAFAYPYGALNNGTLSLIGATNTCW